MDRPPGARALAWAWRLSLAAVGSGALTIAAALLSDRFLLRGVARGHTKDLVVVGVMLALLVLGLAWAIFTRSAARAVARGSPSTGTLATIRGAVAVPAAIGWLLTGAVAGVLTIATAMGSTFFRNPRSTPMWALLALVALCQLAAEIAAVAGLVAVRRARRAVPAAPR